DEATMNRYMRHQQMPWPAIDHRRMRTLPRVRALAGPAPPNLVLVDRSGRVLASGWEGRRRTGLQPVLEAWLQFVAAPVDSARPTSAAPVRPRPGGRRDSGGVSSTDAEYRLLPTRRQDIDVAVNQQQRDRIASGKGFIAALDQSGGSTPRALGLYGIEPSAWSNDEEMFDLVHQMRTRIVTSPAFNGDRILGAILFERTLDGSFEGQDAATFL